MTDRELSLLKQAIMNEVEGYQFYKLAAGDAANPETAETLMMLASEEEKHVAWLKELMKKMEIGPEAEFDVAHLPAPPSPGIFRWEKVDQEDPERALAVMRIGLQMEKNSTDFYLAGAEEVSDERLKKLFKILAAWERAHYDMFLEESERLEKDYWAEQRFSPF